MVEYTWIVDKIFEAVRAIIDKHKRRYYWSPLEPLRSNGSVKNIHEFPATWKIDEEQKRLCGEICGEESFVQSLKLFAITPQGRYPIYTPNYGNEQAESIFSAKGIEFTRQSEYVAAAIMKNYSEWIEQLYSIAKRKNRLYIELKVKGRPDTLKVEIISPSA